MAKKIIVSLPDQPDYAVRVGAGIMDNLGVSLRAEESLAKCQRALILTDENVAPLYLAQCKSSLVKSGFTPVEITVPAGEDTKSLDVAGEVWRAMAQLKLGRDCVVVALGGGVVGDLAGFAASTYMRGVAVVQVPTTLLAMVDSSVGGKTAVNLPEGKNLVGTFYQPWFVCADTATLATLPEREWRCGCAEIAKSAVIDSDDFFFWLTDNAAALAARDEDVTAQAIARSVIFKASIVARDATESAGVRECLNYGHTLGHAIEATTGYGTYSHGAAVAEGMRFAGFLSERLGGTGGAGGASAELVEAQNALLDELGLAPLNVDVPADKLLEAMKTDKKSRGGMVKFVLLDDIGAWRLVDIADTTILQMLNDWKETQHA